MDTSGKSLGQSSPYLHDKCGVGGGVIGGEVTDRGDKGIVGGYTDCKRRYRVETIIICVGVGV